MFDIRMYDYNDDDNDYDDTHFFCLAIEVCLNLRKLKRRLQSPLDLYPVKAHHGLVVLMGLRPGYSPARLSYQ